MDNDSWVPLSYNDKTWAKFKNPPYRIAGKEGFLIVLSFRIADPISRQQKRTA